MLSVKENTLDVELIYWEEFMLSLHEFFQAWDRHKTNPNVPVRNRILPPVAAFAAPASIKIGSVIASTLLLLSSLTLPAVPTTLPPGEIF